MGADRKSYGEIGLFHKRGLRGYKAVQRILKDLYIPWSSLINWPGPQNITQGFLSAYLAVLCAFLPCPDLAGLPHLGDYLGPYGEEVLALQRKGMPGQCG